MTLLSLVSFQIHSLFSLLGLEMAYVTSRGRLTGVVGLKEVNVQYTQDKTVTSQNISYFNDVFFFYFIDGFVA